MRLAERNSTFHTSVKKSTYIKKFGHVLSSLRSVHCVFYTFQLYNFAQLFLSKVFSSFNMETSWGKTVNSAGKSAFKLVKLPSLRVMRFKSSEDIVPCGLKSRNFTQHNYLCHVKSQTYRAACSFNSDLPLL